MTLSDWPHSGGATWTRINGDRCGRTFQASAESGGWPQAGGWSWRDIAVQVVLGWSAISTLLAWAVYRLDKAGLPKSLRDVLLVLVGYGPLLCAICLGAMMAQFRNADLKWDKTIKSGKARLPT